MYSGLTEIPKLEAGRPFAEMAEHPSLWSLERLFGGGTNLDVLVPAAMGREVYRAEYGFVVLCQELLDTLAGQLRGLRVLDAGAGGGYLSSELALRGIDVSAVDVGPMPEQGQFKVWRRDQNVDALTLLPGSFDAVMLCWPSLGKPFAERVARAMRSGQVLVYQGENQGGCTAADGFFELVDSEAFDALMPESQALREHNLRHTGLRDSWRVYRKR